ncbi:glycogen synthase [Candidatus Methylobacter favarea]|uniref:Glycogen synthase n=1 Tax=Candidatus Methylobacter favarea TaxID=2707345 RepID=A0A8S0Y6B0_9GAMM|nr:glycogen synthase GlgA [Candidatus Methylobacter favarea]CAA9890913.1 glycogen synthase [Candidatus Methylobacter favarea]
MHKILFVTPEAQPLIKTGGLGDVAGSLPKALAALGHDVKVLLPRYQALKTQGEVRFLCSLRVDNRNVNMLETRLPDSRASVWLVDYPAYFNYPGNPYVDERGTAWPDNAERFALLCKVAVEIALNRGYLDWQPDIVHCNDWQTGLVPALLALESRRPATLFTIHNLAYQGLFPASTAALLKLPGQLLKPEGLEFHGRLSFIKGGLVYADRITTVSPTYAREIQTPAFGYGLEGLLRHRQAVLTGILNGIDLEQWNPDTDRFIAQPFNAASLTKKPINKAALQARLGLPLNASIPLFGMISRLVEQKGIDLVLDCLPQLLKLPLQLAVLGSGDKGLERQLAEFAGAHPEQLAVVMGYDEALAHLIEAGADSFLMPSRFEPCGLNQMYSQRYGTVPLVRNTGGLADTVADALPGTLADNTATGIVFNEAAPGALLEAVKRALILYSQPDLWRKLQASAMRKDFSWQHSAQQYLALYEQL